MESMIILNDYCFWLSVMLVFAFVWAPKSWTPGELVSAASLNTNIRDHLNESLRTQATALTGSQDDFALDGPFAYLKCNNASALTITGALIDGGNVDGAKIIIEALNSAVTLKHQDAASATNNRIITEAGADLLLGITQRILMVYDGTALRWRADGPYALLGGRTIESKSTTSSYFIAFNAETTVVDGQTLIYFNNDAQTWALMIDSGDHFAIRDVTVGTDDPFRIEKSCPNNTMRLMSDGRIGIGTGTPAASAKLDIDTTTGALLLPQLTTGERDALTAVDGMIIYNRSTKKVEGHENGSWVDI